MNTKIFIILLLLISANSFAQDPEAQIVTPVASNTCSNLTVSFEGLATASAVGTSFTFNGGTLPTGWSSSPYTVGQPCDPANGDTPDNSNYFWATTLSGTIRFVETNALDCSLGGDITFYLRFGNDDPQPGCEEADSGEGVYLQYKLSGGSWTQIAYIDPTSYYTWTQLSYAIPVAAQSTSTQFRWYQTGASGDEYDNWGLEDVVVSVLRDVPIDSYAWNFGDGGTASTQDATHTYTSSGTYSVSFTITAGAYSDTDVLSYTILSNGTPSFNSISNVVVPKNTASQNVSFSGINDGDNCITQTISVSATSNNTSLLPNPSVSYTSQNSSGTLTLNPVADQVGNATVTVTIDDNGTYTGGASTKKTTQRTFNVYVNDYPTNPGAFTEPADDKLNIDYNYDITWGASTDQTASVSYYLEYMLNGGSWTPISSGGSSTTYNNWGGHKNVSLVGRTVQFRVRSYDGTYFSGYTYSSSYEITENEPPVANNDSYKRFYTDSQKPFTFSTAVGVLANDTDPDNDPITAILNTGVNHGSLTLNSNGSFTYTPNNGYKDLNDSFTYYANDGQVNSNTYATVTIEILTPRFTNANGTGVFSDPLNWNCGYVPNIESLNIIIASGTELQVDQDYTCKNLKFEAGASFRCTNGKTLTITGNVLNRNGDVAINVSSALVVSSSISINNQ